GCRPTRRPFVTPASSVVTPTASRFSRARCSAVARAAAITPTEATPSTSCRTRAISRPNSPRRGFRCWSRSSRCARIPAAPASDGAGWDTRSTTAPWWIAAPSSPPTGCGSAGAAVTAAPAGRPLCVTVDLEGAARDLGGLVDGEPVLAGQVVRVVTTGGGGWGDPLEREPELVARDVSEGRVSYEAARDDYGVVLRTRAASD